MPTQFKPIRESVNFRLDPKLLKAARKKADKENTSLTALVVRGLNIVLGNPSQEDCIDFSVEIQEGIELGRGGVLSPPYAPWICPPAASGAAAGKVGSSLASPSL